MTNMDKLYASVAANGPVCVGLDTDFSYLPADFVDSTLSKGENIVRFNKKLIDATNSTAALLKPPRLPQAATRFRSLIMNPLVWMACALTPKP